MKLIGTNTDHDLDFINMWHEYVINNDMIWNDM